MKRTPEQTALMHQLLRELPLLENLAMRAGLHITCRAIQNAVRASGWEAAGDTERANYYAPNTEGFSARGAGGTDTSRPVTVQEDRFLREAAKRASKLVAPGKLAAGVAEVYGSRGERSGAAMLERTRGVALPDGAKHG